MKGTLTECLLNEWMNEEKKESSKDGQSERKSDGINEGASISVEEIYSVE